MSMDLDFGGKTSVWAGTMTIVLHPPDTRNFWQRLMPRFLGGKMKPKAVVTVVEGIRPSDLPPLNI